VSRACYLKLCRQGRQARLNRGRLRYFADIATAVSIETVQSTGSQEIEAQSSLEHRQEARYGTLENLGEPAREELE